MTTLVQQGALVLTAVGLLLGGAASVATRQLLAGLPLLLEFLLAAGLLRLALLDTWVAVATVAAIVAIRKVSTVGIRLANRARAGSQPGHT